MMAPVRDIDNQTDFIKAQVEAGLEDVEQDMSGIPSFLINPR